MSSFPKRKRPHNMRVLQSWIREYADQQQMAESRVRRAVSFMLVALPLEHSLDGEGKPLFAVKGGVSMELRLGLRARTTTLFIRASLKAGGASHPPTRRTRMKLHANARTCPKSRRLLVDRLEGGWSLMASEPPPSGWPAGEPKEGWACSIAAQPQGLGPPSCPPTGSRRSRRCDGYG